MLVENKHTLLEFAADKDSIEIVWLRKNVTTFECYQIFKRKLYFYRKAAHGKKMKGLLDDMDISNC